MLATHLLPSGLTSTRDAESNFAFVVDGVLQTNPNAFNRELLDIAQIEKFLKVLKELYMEEMLHQVLS